MCAVPQPATPAPTSICIQPPPRPPLSITRYGDGTLGLVRAQDDPRRALRGNEEVVLAASSCIAQPGPASHAIAIASPTPSLRLYASIDAPEAEAANSQKLALPLVHSPTRSLAPQREDAYRYRQQDARRRRARRKGSASARTSIDSAARIGGRVPGSPLAFDDPGSISQAFMPVSAEDAPARAFSCPKPKPTSTSTPKPTHGQHRQT
ncbi:hypothetical protein C8Q73DRAFT_449258 [Cubamyces lactineus]|nr:hypothetical protein C8Q73DRAFT_449258 [Cubamyces lactineus]